MKMLIGFIFSLGLTAYSLIQHRKKGILTAIAGIIASIIFLGQFIAGLQ
jgi:hypothetical protein